ncbi:hypothetical protein ABH14_16960 [Brevibacillus brevis]|uniref:hypothetical protein n=1 Tax=Brevibacillus brevis TaxID=1393 RepID=UPI001901136B|nr:hypothetical protein [Brevibacillus brevis]MBH0331466.1 hypothetical protein [Brevibacillus brevis]
MREFFKISFCDGLDKKVIIASNKYEAVGFYLMEVQREQDCCIEDLDEIEVLSPDHSVEVSCIGWAVNKTLMEIYKEKEYGDTPQVVVGLE